MDEGDRRWSLSETERISRKENEAMGICHGGEEILVALTLTSAPSPSWPFTRGCEACLTPLRHSKVGNQRWGGEIQTYDGGKGVTEGMVHVRSDTHGVLLPVRVHLKLHTRNDAALHGDVLSLLDDAS